MSVLAGRLLRMTMTALPAPAVAGKLTAAQGCVRAAAEMPARWSKSKIHHLRPWSAGGTTSLTNASPLCFWHHRCAHDDRFTTSYHRDHSVTYQRNRRRRT